MVAFFTKIYYNMINKMFNLKGLLYEKGIKKSKNTACSDNQ